MVAVTNTSDITHVKITTDVIIRNPDQEMPDLNKLGRAALIGFELSSNEGDLTPDDSTQQVESYSVINIALQADAAVVKKVHESQMEERFPRASITDPRKFAELQVQALVADIDQFVRFLPVESLNILSGHLTRFMEEHGVRNDTYRELHDYAATIQAEPGAETP